MRGSMRRVGAAACEHHEHRQAIGICVRCRRAMCDECITKIDGINHCRPCLNALAEHAKPAVPTHVVSGWSRAGLWSSWLTLWLLVWWMMITLFSSAGTW